MGRNVICAITKEKGNSDTFIKIGAKYYKSQEIYDKAQRQKNAYKQIVQYVCDTFLDYQAGQVFPTSLPQKIKELEFYDNEVILQALQEKEKDILYAISKKNFDSDYGKVLYIFAIIQNSINDVYKKWIREEKQDREMGSKVEETFNMDDIGSKQKGKDISNWLDGDEI